MSISIGMNLGLGFLQDINSQMTDVQTRLSTGKKDLGVVQLLTVTDFQNRVKSLNNVNDGIITALAQFKSASTAITSIRTNLSDTLNAMRDARTSAAKSVSGSTTANVETAAGAEFKINFRGAGSANVNANSLLTGVTVNEASFADGQTFTLSVGAGGGFDAKTISFRVTNNLTESANSKPAALAAAQSAQATANNAVNNATTGTAALLANATNAKNAAAANLPAASAVTSTSTFTNVDSKVISAALSYYGTASSVGGVYTITAATSITQQQLVDFVFKIGGNTTNANNVINMNTNTDASAAPGTDAAETAARIAAVQNALKGGSTAVTLNAAWTTARNAANAMNANNVGNGNITAYYVTINPFNTAVTNNNTAQANLTVANQNLANIQAAQATGASDKPYLVSTVQDYLDMLGNLNDAGKPRFSTTTVAGSLGSNSYQLVGTTTGSLSISSAVSSTTIGQLFAAVDLLSAPEDKTNPYKYASWSTSSSGGVTTSTLSRTSGSGTGAGTTTSAADAKRSVAANSFRSFLDQMKQLVKDSRVNGVNILNGENVSATVNADGDKYNFQLKNDAGTASQSIIDALGINPADFNLIVGGTKTDGTTSVKNDFDNNVDLDAAIAAMTTALAKVDITKSNISTAQSTLQSRSDFNSALVKIFNDASTSLQTNDSTADAAELASLQTRQQFANSILAIIKQGDQNPLQLLR